MTSEKLNAYQESLGERPGIVRPMVEPPELNTAAHRRESRESSALIVIVCFSGLLLVYLAAWIGGR
jgi:hypothetical protein